MFEEKGASGTKKFFVVSGLHCFTCALAVEKALERIKGVKSASVDFAAEKASVDYDEGTVREEKLLKAIGDLGYGVARSEGSGVVA